MQAAALPPSHPELVALLAWWEAARAGAPMPPRRAVDPVALGRWLGQLALFDVLEGGADFFCRVHGTDLARRLGCDFTGKRLAPADRAYMPDTLRDYRTLVEARRPLLWRGAGFLPATAAVYEKLGLPFADGAGAVTAILAGIYPARRG